MMLMDIRILTSKIAIVLLGGRPAGRRLLPSLGLAIVFGAASLPNLALAQGRSASSSVDLARAAETLRPGEWVWAPQIALSGPLLVFVDLSAQRATIYRNGVRFGVTTVSSGKPGHETPTGVFTILQKDADHRSSTYNNAPMFYMERLTWDGVALHAGGLPGYPESHGCVHLPLEFARLLFRETTLGATVVVAGDAATRIGGVPAGVTSPFSAEGQPKDNAVLDAQPWRWTPDRSPEGPMTVILSKSDQTAVVLRNGAEIGRSVIQLDDSDPQVHVLTLTQDEQGRPHWLYAGLPGREEDARRELDAETLGRLQAPDGFYRRVREAMRPGDTILITPASVGTTTSGRQLTVMDALDEPVAQR